MSDDTPPPKRRWLDRMFQIRLPVFVFMVAGCAADLLGDPLLSGEHGPGPLDGQL